MIWIANLQKKHRVPTGKVRRLVRRILREERAGKKSLSFAFVDDREIRKLNRKFLRHDYVTDVLAFRMDGTVFGEVVVSTETADREAQGRGITREEELLRYVAHGVLHLLGYEDHTPKERERMWERQEGYLRLLGHSKGARDPGAFGSAPRHRSSGPKENSFPRGRPPRVAPA